MEEMGSEFILKMVDKGIINARDALIMCLKWIREDEINVMIKIYNLHKIDNTINKN